MKTTPLFSPNAPAPIGPYSPALLFGDLVFISGQGPVDPATGKVVAGGFSAQANQVFANLDTLLTAASSSRNQVLKVNVYLQNMDDFQAMNAVYAKFFLGCTYPPPTTIQAARLPLDILIEVEMIAFKE